MRMRGADFASRFEHDTTPTMRIKNTIENTGLIVLGMTMMEPNWWLASISVCCFLYCSIYDWNH